MDKGDLPENWLETSASAMFVYALKRGADEGLLRPAETEVARKGWNGLLSRIAEDAKGRPVIEDTSEGTSVQKDAAGYFARKRLSNAPHGLCGMLLAASAMEWPSTRPAAAPEKPAAPVPPRAFPGAEGFGALALGGRGGDVYHVTSLADEGPGSLRYGVQTACGPRTIVFDLSGTIILRSVLAIDKPFLTLAGQTAPGDGVTVAGFTTSISGTHDVVVRYMRFRAGDINCPSFQGDALNVVESQDVIIDHVSASWSVDEALSVTRSDRVTVQWSIIAESLNASCHAKGHHGYGSLLRWGKGGITIHHTLYAHHESRSPRLGDDLGLDFVNNVVYDWGKEAGYSGPASEGFPRLNYVANTLVAGPSTPAKARKVAFTGGSDRTEIYQQGNRVDASARGKLAMASGDWSLFAGAYRARSQRFPFPEVETEDAETACRRVLTDSGASLVRDSADLSVLRSVAKKAGRLIDSQGQVGGWPRLRTATPPVDSDRDGMPDAWETANGLNPQDPADGAALRANGISNLEIYLDEKSRTPATAGKEP
jgi:pectate lyase